MGWEICTYYSSRTSNLLFKSGSKLPAMASLSWLDIFVALYHGAYGAHNHNKQQQWDTILKDEAIQGRCELEGVIRNGRILLMKG